MFIYVFVALVEHKLLTSILHMYLRCFTIYNVHYIGTKGSQSRERQENEAQTEERYMALPGANELRCYESQINSYF